MNIKKTARNLLLLQFRDKFGSKFAAELRNFEHSESEWFECAIDAIVDMYNQIAICPKCGGSGNYPGHADTPHYEGECDGDCPVAVECALCEGDGKCFKFDADNYNYGKQRNKNYDDGELPF